MVYKTLALLEGMGGVVEPGFGDDDNRYNGSWPTPHPHLVFVCCRTIIDPWLSLAWDLATEMTRVSAIRSWVSASIPTASAPYVWRLTRSVCQSVERCAEAAEVPPANQQRRG